MHPDKESPPIALKVIERGQVVVMDNLSAHRSSNVDELIEATGGYVLRLPPYSADLKPIEMAISKVKSVLRNGECRTIETLHPMIGQALSSVTPRDVLATSLTADTPTGASEKRSIYCFIY